MNFNAQEKPQNIPEGSGVFFNEQQTERLKQRTKELIKYVVNNKFQTLIFMDRSARPISWMLRAAWKEYAEDEPLPVIRFINIGREKGESIGWKGYYEDYRNIKETDSDDEEDKELKKKQKNKLKKEEDTFWFNPENKDFIEDFRNSIKGKEILIVDDFKGSGFSAGLAREYLERNISDIQTYLYIFLKEEKGDAEVFKKEGWNGAHLPWNTDKSYTLLGEDADLLKVTASPERDLEKRKKGLEFRKKIEGLFAN